MIISCDIDGVLNNLTECVLQLYNEDSGDNLCEQDIKTYSIEQYVKSEYRNRIAQYFLDSRIWERLKWDVEWIAQIIDDNVYDLYFTTATSIANIYIKSVELASAITLHSKHDFTYIYYYIQNRLIVMQNKQMVKADVVIDDCIDNLQLSSETTINILLTKPWNMGFVTEYNLKHNFSSVIICDTVKDIQRQLKIISKSKR